VDLKEGRLLSFDADDLDSLGELLTKARIARGLTQAELGEILGMTQQQVQRYERDGWQKTSLWRLAEAADALGLDLNIRARLPASKTARQASGEARPSRRQGPRTSSKARTYSPVASRNTIPRRIAENRSGGEDAVSPHPVCVRRRSPSLVRDAG
jgi:transcriptional regulator with XRE-family HTH domain